MRPEIRPDLVKSTAIGCLALAEEKGLGLQETLGALTVALCSLALQVYGKDAEETAAKAVVSSIQVLRSSNN